MACSTFADAYSILAHGNICCVVGASAIVEFGDAGVESASTRTHNLPDLITANGKYCTLL